LIIFASGVLQISPNSAKLSFSRCSSVRYFGNCAIILDATLISFLITSIPALAAYDLTIGNKAYVANAGASSVPV